MEEVVQCGVPTPSPPESLKVQTGDSTDTTSSFHVEKHKIVSSKPIQKRVKAQVPKLYIYIYVYLFIYMEINS